MVMAFRVLSVVHGKPVNMSTAVVTSSVLCYTATGSLL